MRFRMFPTSASVLLLMTCCAVPIAAQTNSPSRPIQRLLEDFQSADKPSANSSSDAARSSSGNKATGQDPSALGKAREAPRFWQENGQLRSSAPDAGKGCAHILVYKAPDVDAAMLQEVPKEFASNMPKLQGWPQSCCGDIRSDTVAQVKPYNPRGKFLPVPGKPEYQLLP